MLRYPWTNPNSTRAQTSSKATACLTREKKDQSANQVVSGSKSSTRITWPLSEERFGGSSLVEDVLETEIMYYILLMHHLAWF